MPKFEAPKNKKLITFFVMLAAIIEIVDSTIANVALPHIQGAVGATYSEITWVLTSYIVAGAIMMPVTGWLVGVYGTRKVLLGSVTGFTFSSMLCGTSTSLIQIIIYRLIQGVSGAALIPISQTVMMDINPPEKRGQAMAIWSMGITLAPILGPVIGGYFTDYHNWRWIFFINLPAGILTFIGIYVIFPKQEKNPISFDFLGFFLISIAIFSLQVMLERGEQVDWLESNEIKIYLIICIISFFSYLIFGTLRKKDQFIPLEIFKDRNYVFGSLIGFFNTGILLSFVAIVPQFLQILVGYQVFDAGILVAPRGIGVFLAMIFVSKLINKVDARFLISFGLSMSASALYQMSFFDIDVAKETIVYTGILQGFGLGFVFVPLTTLTFKTLDQKFRSQATPIFSLLRHTGGAVGIATIVFFTFNSAKLNHAIITESVKDNSKNLAKYINQTHLEQNLRGYMILDREVTKQSMIIGYINAFRFGMYVSLFVIPLVFLISNKKEIFEKKNIIDAH